MEAAEATGAWNVGGVYEAVGATEMERAVACALDSPFGGVNWTASSKVRAEADTVYLGAFRPIAFVKAGLYDESLIRNQDDELNLRIRLAGGMIVFDPTIRSVYRPRGSLRAVWRQYFDYGFWKIEVMRKHRQVSSARSLAPAALVIDLGLVGVASALHPRARRLLLAQAAVYGVAATTFAAKAMIRRNEPAKSPPRVVAVFPCFHLAYGSGMVAAATRAAVGRGRERTDAPRVADQ